jgi:hypothetical protein
MNRDEFRDAIVADPNLSGPIERAAKAAKPTQMAVVTEVAVVALIFPIARYTLVHIGLPWLQEAKQWSELWQQKVHRWIDENYEQEGLDPDDAEAASEALRKELERITDSSARASWERLADSMKEEGRSKEWRLGTARAACAACPSMFLPEQRKN